MTSNLQVHGSVWYLILLQIPLYNPQDALFLLDIIGNNVAANDNATSSSVVNEAVTKMKTSNDTSPSISSVVINTESFTVIDA